jgi:hypothetical protein
VLVLKSERLMYRAAADADWGIAACRRGAKSRAKPHQNLASLLQNPSPALRVTGCVANWKKTHCRYGAINGTVGRSSSYGAQVEIGMNSFRAIAVALLALVANISVAGTWIAPPAGSPVGLMQRIDRAKWIAAGAKSAERVVYVFTDPDCPFCNDLWKALQTARAPDVQIRYLLVAVIDADSKGKGAAILESKDPAAALEKSERNYEHGGIPPKADVSPASTETISFNGDLMGALHIFGTPGLVYLDENRQVKVFAGMPDDKQLRTIVGKR